MPDNMPVTREELVELQADSGLKYPPTQLTYHYRRAVAGHEAEKFLSLGYQWEDKPHRLVFDLCSHIEQAEALSEHPAGIAAAAKVEPVAWLYERDDERRADIYRWHPHQLELGFTETPLYAHPPEPPSDEWARAIEAAAKVALCHSDDRPRRDSMDWNDGYIDGCRGASEAIRALQAPKRAEASE
jgi:hypothetical protein